MQPKSSSFVVALSLLPLLPAGAPAAQEIRFAPEPGSTLRKTLRSSGQLTLLEAEIQIGDDPQVPEADFTVAWEREVVLRDRYAAVAEGRPTRLDRTFENLAHQVDVDLEIEVDGNPEVEARGDADSASELEGRAVVFSWDAESGAYRAAYDEASEPGPPELLSGLVEDVDLRALLPGKDVQEGQGWEVAGSSLRSLLVPGGDLGFDVASPVRDWQPIAAGVDPAFYSDLGSLLPNEGEWKAACTLASLREVEGERFAVIDVELQVDGRQDLREAMQECIARIAGSLPEGMELEVTRADLDVELEGTGQLVWDLAAGRVSTFDLQWDVELELERSLDAGGEGEEMVVETRLVLEGKIEQKLSVE